MFRINILRFQTNKLFEIYLQDTLYADYMCLYEEYFATKEKIAEYQTEIISLASQVDNYQERVDELEKAIDVLMVHAETFKTELEKSRIV